MRLTVSYTLSAVVHLGAYALLWVCLPWVQLAMQVQVTAGKPICVVMVMAQPESQPQEDSPPVEIELPAELEETVQEIEPQELELKAPAEQPPLAYETPLVESAEVEIPPPVEPNLPPRATLPPSTPPPPPKLVNEDVPRAKPAAPASIASTSVPFQAESELGLDVDELPTKLPTNTPPVYPADALAAQIEGRVILRVLVAADGAVRSAALETSSGNSELDQSATLAVRQWKFTPAKRSGRAVEFEVMVPVNFLILR